MSPARAYWVLLERESASAPWTLEFGAYDRADVDAEREDRRDHDVRAANLRVVRLPCAHRQPAITAWLADLNR